LCHTSPTHLRYCNLWALIIHVTTLNKIFFDTIIIWKSIDSCQCYLEKILFIWSFISKSWSCYFSEYPSHFHNHNTFVNFWALLKLFTGIYVVIYYIIKYLAWFLGPMSQHPQGLIFLPLNGNLLRRWKSAKAPGFRIQSLIIFHS
jgi:hypothetical protein